MSGMMRAYIRGVDAVNFRVGRIAMYGIFVLMAILLLIIMSFTKLGTLKIENDSLVEE